MDDILDNLQSIEAWNTTDVRIFIESKRCIGIHASVIPCLYWVGNGGSYVVLSEQ